MMRNDLVKVTNSDYESVHVIKEDKEENTRIVSFNIDDLDGQVNALVSIEKDGKVTEHSVRLFFEENSIRESDGLPVDNVEEIETPTEPEPPIQSDLDPENLVEGVYKLDYSFLEKGKDTLSTMDGFTDGPAYVKVDKDGKQSVALTLTSADWIKGFKVNNKDAKVLQEEKKAATRVVEFTVDNLTEKQAGWVSVDVPDVYSTEHDVDLAFNTDSLVTADDSEYPENENKETEDTGKPGAQVPQGPPGPPGPPGPSGPSATEVSKYEN